MTDESIDFRTIISKAKGKLIEQKNLNSSKVQITTSDIEVLQKLHSASCTSIYFTIENRNKTHLFIPDAFSPFVINKNNFEACFFNKLEAENDKLIANYFYGDSIIVEFENHIETQDLNSMFHTYFKKNKGVELNIDFFETKLKIIY